VSRVAPVRARARARRGEGAKLRDVIIDATERLLVDAGDPDDVSIRAIADAVQVTPPSIYLHFTDKDDLILAVCARAFAAFDATIEQATADDPVESLRRRAHAYVRFGLENPAQYRILFMSPGVGESAVGDDGTRPGTLAFTHLVEAVQRAIDAGALRPGLDAFMTATGLWTSMHGITSLLIALPGFPWPETADLIDHVCRTALLGLAAGSEHDPEGGP
jgi:AcrR family transcriptional regulator